MTASTRVLLPTPCRNPHGGPHRQPCPGQVEWEDHGRRRLGTCTTCHHDYAHELGPYEAHHATTASEETARG